MRKARGRTPKRHVIGQRSVQINQGTRLRTFLQRDHVINLLVERKEIGHVKDHQIVDMASHTPVNGHEARARRKTETGQEAEAQGGDLVVEAPEKVDHGAEVQEEIRTGHVVGVLRGKDLEAKVQEETGVGHEVPAMKVVTSKDRKKSNSFVFV